MTAETGAPDDDPQPASTSGDFGAELIERLAGREKGFGRYALEGELARGGQGAILRVWDEDLRRHLAMKVTLARGDSAGGSDTDAKTLGRFLEEAQVTGQLDHPGIVPIHELGLDHEGGVYFTMRLVKGIDLGRVFEMVPAGEDGWNKTRVLGVLLKVCEALSYAHSKRVIHRDLKPANIMVGRFGEVYVMDWGLARVQGTEDRKDIRVRPASSLSMSRVRSDRREHAGSAADSPLVTMDGDVLGTPAYMSPEQARGDLEAMGPASDVYSMGAILYQLLAGHMPYVPSDARLNAYAVWGMVQNGPPTPVSQLAKDAPAELVAICEKAMAREPRERYADMRELAEDVRAFLEKRVVSAYETGAVAEFRKWVQRNRPLATSIAAALALAIGGLSWVSIVQSQARRAVAAKNLDLEAATRAAQEQERVATRLARDVLSLSAQKDLDDLVARAEELWPAAPEKIPEYDRWLADARELIEGRPADPVLGLGKRPSLAEHEASLARLRAGARPANAQEAQAEREAHPRYAELEAKRAELTWRSRMLGLEAWPSEADVASELAAEAPPADAEHPKDIAPAPGGRGVHGSEPKTLARLRRAMAAAGDAERAAMRIDLADALFGVGRLDEAIEEARRWQDEMTEAAPAEGNDRTRNKPPARVRVRVRRLERLVSDWRGVELPKRRAELDALAAEVDELERVVSRPRSHYYDDGDARWWDAQLSKLVAGLKALGDPKAGLMSDQVTESFGWGVAKRREFARTIAERSVDGAQARALWSEATASIRASPKYAGLVVSPQLGLLPIGEDPESGLWEFVHLQTGDRPARAADGRLILTEDTGLVFVLLPGGTFWMGAQKHDPDGRNYDPQALDNELPVHQVEVPAFFSSKYEMTQGQWERFTGTKPSEFREDSHPGQWKSFNAEGRPWSTLHPVESVSWTNCVAVMGRLGCALPTERQWEYLARGGSSSVYWTGNDLASLAGAANLADAFGKSQGSSGWEAGEEDFEDGNTLHAEVGSYRANAFGLHDVIGNVAEWCQDASGPYLLEGVSRAPTGQHIHRGGSYYDVASSGRSACRRVGHVDSPNNTVGLRPARALSP